MERRTFLKWVTHALGALFGLILLVPGAAYLIDPRNRKPQAAAFKRVARLRDLPEPGPDGTAVPKQVVVREANRRDAWTIHPDEVIGRVWLVRQRDGNVTAFTTICPHLGCPINFDGANNQFSCPCHGGTFDRMGKRLDPAKNPAPRGMDELEVKKVPVDGQDGDFHIEVKFESFRQGSHDKIVRT